jgi:hypothetical protein
MTSFRHTRRHRAANDDRLDWEPIAMLREAFGVVILGTLAGGVFVLGLWAIAMVTK